MLWRAKLLRLDDDLNHDIQAENIVFACMQFRIPMGSTAPDSVEEVEPALVRQASEIADEIGKGMIVASAGVPLENL